VRLILEKLRQKAHEDDLLAISMVSLSLLVVSLWMLFVAWALAVWP
jgi:hypothetical protein